MKRKLVYVCLLAMVAGGMMSFSYDIPEKQAVSYTHLRAHETDS